MEGTYLSNRTLYFGDNLEILRQKFPTLREDKGYFDLIYLDPPFNSKRSYNVLFKEGIVDSSAQLHAFEDSWHWTKETLKTFEELVGTRPSNTDISQEISNLMIGFEKIIGHNDMMAYLTMMTIRLIELHRVLKGTGSLYLHCDPTASHYLKIVLDVIFGKTNFVNEIIWKRATAHSDTKQGANHYGRIHDVILFYTKSNKYTYNTQYLPYSESYVRKFYRHVEPKTGRRYTLSDLAGPGGAAKGNPYYEVMGIKRYWQFSKENMDKLIKEGRVVQTKPGNVPRFKRYLDEMPGVSLQDVWIGINPISAQANERLGYQTQKPESLLEMIIKTSTNEGDWILDPFCGCGTTVSVAQKLNRKWIGIDITALAINLIRHRINNQFGEKVKIHIDGLPKDLQGAMELFKKDPFEFQYWVLSLINAMPTKGKSKGSKRGADKGIDGIIAFKDTDKSHKVIYKKIIVSVKGGKNISVVDIRDLKGVVEREKSEGGILVTLQEPTKPMNEEANISGFFRNNFLSREFPKIQIFTVGDLLNGKKPEIPSGVQEVEYFKKAPKSNVQKGGKQKRLFGESV